MTPTCDHEWERAIGASHEICTECGEMREYEPDMDDGRDHTPPYEP